MSTRLSAAVFLLAASAFACCFSPSNALGAVMTYPGLTSIDFWEVSGPTSSYSFAPNSAAMTTQLGVLNGANFDFAGVPGEYYDVFYSDANGNFNLNGNYVTVEAVYPNTTGGGGLNIAAVDLLIGPVPSMVCRADVLASWVGMGNNYIAGSEVFAADPTDVTPVPTTLTTMGNTAGVPGRLRVTVGWKKILVPEPATAALFSIAAVAVGGSLRRRTRR